MSDAMMLVLEVYREKVVREERDGGEKKVEEWGFYKGCLPCDDDEVDPGSSLVKMDSDELDKSEYDCPYEEEDSVGAMLLQDVEVEEPLVKEETSLDVLEEEKHAMNVVERSRNDMCFIVDENACGCSGALGHWQ
ncbi:hypothetical protein L7F22_067733, partial [Adiantum nelumboides]|nr:hypothetical protein [Adiantum nelumboides]